jgi:BASS family bile acid:Na+ symporter
VIAQTVIGSVEMSLPAAVYGVLMFFVALAFGFMIRGRSATAARPEEREPVPDAAASMTVTGDPAPPEH